MRCFLAINLPDALRRHVWEAAEPLRAAAPSVSWVREPLIHLTVKFFGEQPDEMAEPFRALLEEIAARHARPVLVLTHVGAFPNFRTPAVVWVGVEPDPRLELVQHDVERSFESFGIPPDGRPFRPHITLGRVRPRAARDARRLADVAAGVAFGGECDVSSIDLMRSTLGRGGPSYETIVCASLRSE